MKKIRNLLITFDEASIRFLELTIKNNQIVKIHNTFVIENDVIYDNNTLDKEKWINLLKEQKKKRKVKAKIAYINIPTSSVIIRQQNMPDVSEKELKQMLIYEIGNNIHLPFNNPIYDVIKTETKSESSKTEQSICSVTLVAAPGSLINPLIEGLQEVKIKAKSIEVPGISLYHFFKENYPNQAYESILIIHIRRDGININILDENTIWFTRHVNLSIFDYMQKTEIATLLEKVNDFEDSKIYIKEIANEIDYAINFFKYSLDNRENIISGCWVASEFQFSRNYYDYLHDHLDMEIYKLSYHTNEENIQKLLGFEVGLGTIFKEVK